LPSWRRCFAALAKAKAKGAADGLLEQPEAVGLADTLYVDDNNQMFSPAKISAVLCTSQQSDIPGWTVILQFSSQHLATMSGSMPCPAGQQQAFV